MDQGTADDHTYAGIAALIPYFHAAGWVAGAGWTIAQNQDAEHFEVSQETLQLWSIQGLLSPSPPVTPSNDFNHDGFSDVLWRNNSTGAWGYSDIHGNTGNGLGDTSTSFKVAGVGDFNNDGFSMCFGEMGQQAIGAIPISTGMHGMVSEPLRPPPM